MPSQSRELTDMLGLEIGRLTVTGRAPDDHRGNVCWDTLCQCGSVTVTLATTLREAARLGSESSCRACRRTIGSRKAAVAKGRTKSGKMCPLCANLPHRVEGATCDVCNLPSAPQSRLAIEEISIYSTVGR